MECNLFCFSRSSVQRTQCLKSDGVIDEVDFFTIIIESDYDLVNHCLLITDIPIKLKCISKTKDKSLYSLEEDSVREYFYSQDFVKSFDIYKKEFKIPKFDTAVFFYKLFVNYPIGLCEIVLLNEKGSEAIDPFMLNVTSSKIESEEFKSLVSYVENKGNSVWAKYSLIKQQADSFSEADRIDWLLVFCRSFIKELEDKYLTYFSLDKITVLKSYSEVESFNNETTIAEDSIAWLLGNLNVLTPTSSYDLNKVLVKNRPFLPTDILASKLKDSTDNPENQLIHGFVQEMVGFVSEISTMYKNQLVSFKKEKFDDVVMYYAYNRKIKMIDESLRSLFSISNFLCQEIPVSRLSIDFSNINKIQSKEHYFFVYNQLLRWLLYKGANYRVNNRYFKGIKRLDELFERGCFYLIVDTFIKLGFNITFETANNDEDLPRKISFEKSKRKVNLYYQSLPSYLMTIKKSSNSLTPDFIIEFEDSSYVILDAKYKKLINIEKYDYPELVLKYLHGIGPKIGGVFNTIGLIVLFPDNENISSFYQKNDFCLDGTKNIFPVIGSIGIGFDDSNTTLKEIIEQIIRVKYSDQVLES